jgi:hypothetical protein
MTNDFRELVAALAHEQWSGWMLYMIGKSQKKSDGSVVIPSALVERWMRQMTTAYNNLPENEKDSDRDEADRFIKLFSENQAITEIAALADIREALGVGSEPMLADLPVIAREIRRDADLYKKVMRLNPLQFKEYKKRLTNTQKIRT